MGKKIRNLLFYVALFFVFGIYLIVIGVILTYIYIWLGIPQDKYITFKRLGFALVLLVCSPIFRKIVLFLQIKIKKDLMFMK